MDKLAGAWKGAKELEVSGILKSLHNRKRFGNPPRFRSAHLSKDLVQHLELNVVDSFQRLFVTNFWNGYSYDFCFRPQIVDLTSFVFSLNKISCCVFCSRVCLRLQNSTKLRILFASTLLSVPARKMDSGNKLLNFFGRWKQLIVYPIWSLTVQLSVPLKKAGSGKKKDVWCDDYPVLTVGYVVIT